MQQDQAVFQISNHLVGIGHEVGRQVAAIELHAFDNFVLGFEALVLFDSDHAFVADFLHCVSDLAADFFFAVGGNRADLCDFVAILDLACRAFDRLDNLGGGQIDPALEIHRVHPGSYSLETFANDGLGQNRGGGGAVAGFVVGAAGDFFHHLRAHVFELVLKFDFLGNRHTVFGDAR